MPRLAECHPERPHKARGLCGACYQRERYNEDPEYRERTLEANRGYRETPEARDRRREREARPEVAAERKARDRARHRRLRQDPELWDQTLARARERYAENPKPPEEHRRQHLWSRYRLTPEEWAAMMEEQEGLCYLCRDPLPENTRLIHIDHDHDCCPERGRSCGDCVRGLACGPCNTGIGAFGDDPERMRRVAHNLAMEQTVRQFSEALAQLEGSAFAASYTECFREPVGVGSNAPTSASSEVAINPH